MAECKTIAVCNQKGGVAKTTSTLNVGVCLAKNGKKVLLVDCDPQSSLTKCCGYRDKKLDITISSLLKNEMYPDEQVEISKEDVLLPFEGTDLLPSNIRLAGLESEMVSVLGREYLLKRVLERFKEDYDYILIDCPPTLMQLTVNALTASDSLIIPCEANTMATDGLQDLMRTVNTLKIAINPKLTIDGLFLTRYDARTNLAKAINRELREWGARNGCLKVFNTIIPQNARVADCPSTDGGVSVFTNDARSDGAIAYKNLTKEVFDIGKERTKSRSDGYSR